MVAIAIMQGRLAAPENNAIQAFPRASWRDEFARAAAAGLDAIEWIHDAYGSDANPILTSEGRSEMRVLIEEHGIAVRSLCADWFMDFPSCAAPRTNDAYASAIWKNCSEWSGA